VTILIKSTLRKRRPALRAQLERLLGLLGLQNAEVSVLLVGDRAMRGLNRRYRQKDRTTDVLSFAFREGEHGAVRPDLLGDLVVCIPAAERQARAAGETLAGELDRLLVHGLLHLLGYDHERGPADARKMERQERRLREALRR